jgi:hypothetical protein
VLAAPELSEQKAQGIAHAAFGALAAAGLVNARNLADLGPEVALTKVGIAAPGEMAKEYVTEYAFTWLQHLNGIPFANAGVRIVVDRTGALARVRLGEVLVASRPVSNGDLPAGAGYEFSVQVDDAQIEARFAAERPSARTVLSRIMYIVPDGVASAVIEPLHVFSFSVTSDNPADTLPALSRRTTLGYSIRDPTAKPHEFATPRASQTVGNTKHN